VSDIRESYSYYNGTQEMRDFYKFTGIRILFISEGLGTVISFASVVLQIASGLALLALASIITDFVMLYLYPKELRDEYWSVKVTDSEDFSDLTEKLNLIRIAREKKLKKKEKQDNEE